MASTASPEASEIRRRGRQRLIGAVVLVALLVVFVPMLLDSEPKPAREGPDLVIPPKDPVQPLPMPAPKAAAAGEAAKAAPDAAKADVPKAAPEAAKIEPAKVEAAKVEPTKPASAKPEAAKAQVAKVEPAAAEPARPAATSAQAPHGGFAVQVGAFRDEAKLRQARDKLAAARVPHYTERLEAKGGGLTRLRAGPFETREKAEAALAALKRASLDGKVIPLP